ncbi:hypothetical protein AXF42_Ash014111 [Apostasia shenzhenica]|uniref:Uncharacterized protein n=1 Tax=Apostasia shenzhenica TaxID=1088818 RepID=A0A2I0A9G0_9ASPA|nr:hypothetical protein AXF42_Ash014111 [Apostasia shenzhenica]
MDEGRSFGSEEKLPERRKKTGSLPLAVLLSFNDREVHPHCPNASNPFHKCGRHCLHKIPFIKLLDGEKSEWSGFEGEREKISDRRGVNPNCPNASNPFHKCVHDCFEKKTDNCQDIRERPEKDKRTLTIADKHDINPKSNFASSEDSYKKDYPEEVMKREKMFLTAEKKVNYECKNASNPFHVCAEYCFQKAPESDHPGQVAKFKKLKEKKNEFSIGDRTGVNPHCKYASNPFHRCAEYCFQNLAEKNIAGDALISKANEAVGGAEKIDVDSNCDHASNPYHKCTEYCFQGTHGKNRTVQHISGHKIQGLFLFSTFN